MFALGQSQAAQPAVVRVRFVGQEPAVRLEGAEPLPGRVNVFSGQDPAAWRTGLPTFAEVWYRDLWPGIDLVFRGIMAPKSEFHVRPGARLADIPLVYEAAERPRLTEAGGPGRWCRRRSAAWWSPGRTPTSPTGTVGHRSAAGSSLRRPRRGSRPCRSPWTTNLPIVIDPFLVHANRGVGSWVWPVPNR